MLTNEEKIAFLSDQIKNLELGLYSISISRKTEPDLSAMFDEQEASINGRLEVFVTELNTLQPGYL